jgi:hypothetical protein
LKNISSSIIFSIIILILAILLALIEVYYIAIALVLVLFGIWHRVIWSLLKSRKFPPVDERVHENINKSLRNSLIFLGMASFLTISFYLTHEYDPVQPDVGYFLGGMLLLMGIVYVLSYIFYDKAEGNLKTGEINKLRVLALITAISVVLLIINIFFVNTYHMVYPNPWYMLVYGFIRYILPFVSAICLIYGSVIFIKGLSFKSS